MLKVAVVQKWYSKTSGHEQLIGYTIVTREGESKRVRKEDLIAAIRSGAVKVVNMTLSKNGKLIGSLKVTPRMFEDRQVDIRLHALEVYNTNKRLVGVLFKSPVERSAYFNGGIALGDKVGIYPQLDAIAAIKAGAFDNLSFSDEKLVVGEDVKKKSFKAVLKKYISVLRAIPECEVTKEGKDEYRIDIAGINTISDPVLYDLVMTLVCYELAEEKINPLYVNGASLHVKCVTGIKDVRKAMTVIKSQLK